MKLNIPKDWFLSRLQQEEGEIEAGIPPWTPHITCPVCWRTSYNAGDIHNGYCGHCHAFTKPPDMFGEPEQDWAAQVLGTGYWRFKSQWGVAGLMKWREGRLDLLAVHSQKPGSGQFRQFMRQAKAIHFTICVWVVWNDDLATILKKYGFRFSINEDDEKCVGYRWDAQYHNPAHEQS